jgi:hypothetical protein
VHSNIGKFTRLSWCMSLVLAANPMFADARPLLLTPQKNVTVNSAAVAQSSTVFVGDKIETGNDSKAVLLASGVQVAVAPDSAVVYASSGLMLSQGAMWISTSSGTSAQLGNLRVKPANGTAKFEMINMQGQMRLKAVAGALTVSDGKTVAVLHEGEQIQSVPLSVSESTDPPAQQGDTEDNEKDKHGPPSPAIRRPFWAGIPGWVLIVSAAAVAVTIAIIEVTKHRRHPLTPHTP